MLFNGLFCVHLYCFMIVNVGQKDETSGFNSQTGYKTKLLKHREAGQQCKKHTPIAFCGNTLSNLR